MINDSSSTDKVLKKYEAGFHNLLMEPKLKDTVMKDIQEWILTRVP